MVAGQIHVAQARPKYEVNPSLKTLVVMIGGYYLTAIIVFEADDIILPQIVAGLNLYYL